MVPRFALPILGWACVLVFLLSFLLRGGRRSRLSAIAMCIGTVGLMALGVEYCMDRFFRAAWQPTWSLVVVVICVGLIIPARRAPRALAARGGPPTLQYVKKGGHGARHAFPFLVPVVGLEPTRSRPGGFFESATSTIPSHRR